jgi:hypothetical protein
MAKKQYGAASSYETKLKRVMERLGVKQYDWNYDRHGGMVEFSYKSENYRFEHTISKAKSKGQDLAFGSDAFAQVVLALEALARLSERGIYDFGQLAQGFLALPAPVIIPDCFKVLGFDQIPQLEEIQRRYKEMVKTAHPDTGGDAEAFKRLTEARDLGLAYFDKEAQP